MFSESPFSRLPKQQWRLKTTNGMNFNWNLGWNIQKVPQDVILPTLRTFIQTIYYIDLYSRFETSSRGIEMTANSLYCSLYLDYIECPGKAGMKIIKTLLPSSCGGFVWGRLNISLSYPVVFMTCSGWPKMIKNAHLLPNMAPTCGVINRYLRCVILMNVVQVELR